MKTSVQIVTSVVMLALAGCVHPPADLGASQQNHASEASGWPFRWKVTSFNGGTAMTRVMVDLPSGPTKADTRLKEEILSQIGKARYYQHFGPPVIEDVRLLPDGREVWVEKNKIPNKTKGRAYVVTLISSRQAGSSFSISGLVAFQKSG